MKRSGLFLRVKGIGSGALLMAAGVLSIWRPRAMAEALILLSGLLLLCGCLDIAAFLTCRRAAPGAGWMLADGLLTVLTGSLPLCGRRLAGAVPVIFSIWILFSGIVSAVRALDLRAFRVRGWGWFLVLGVARIVLGVLLFLQPAAGWPAAELVVGIVLLFQGLAALTAGLCSKRLLSDRPLGRDIDGHSQDGIRKDERR